LDNQDDLDHGQSICPKCNNPIYDSKFCGICGTPLGQAKGLQEPQLDYRICSSCGQGVYDSKFCGVCGAPQEEKKSKFTNLVETDSVTVYSSKLYPRSEVSGKGNWISQELKEKASLLYINLLYALIDIVPIVVGTGTLVTGISLVAIDFVRPKYVSGIEQALKYASGILAPLPGFPLWSYNFYDYGLLVAGIMTLFIGIDLCILAVGLWRRHRVARILGIILFALGAFQNLKLFLISGVKIREVGSTYRFIKGIYYGSPLSVIGLRLNILRLSVLVRQDIYEKNRS
jgi:hypothetical protein